ncbi:MAG: cysteine synthase family protein [Lachnospiraceae bacterium]|nr:cysteine synthase family protein [Lachnospiraceae bacterium]
MKVYNDISEMVGKTPILKLNHLGIPKNINLYAKLEMFNPLGSVKDRIGIYMLDEIIKNGTLKPGGTIIEGTAGNTGIGTALAALNKGYRLILVVPDKFSKEKQAIMRALGAEIVNTPREEGMLGATRKSEELLKAIPDAVSINQFETLSNPKAHYETTGPEIYEQLEGKIDYFVAGAGSGGTFSGSLKYLKEQDSNIKGVLADPYGSIIGGGEHADYDIEGIGNDFIAATMDVSLIDKVFKVSDDEAFETSRILARSEGIIGGSSSGAALSASLKLIDTLKENDKHINDKTVNIVVVLPDSGERYYSKDLF